ncbi:MAG: hypothetical protein OEY51_12995, partial [Cyclobacteriaceae bacterium]|nr:hypothetical protein [Cyclobacteriaceae bacterium]
MPSEVHGDYDFYHFEETSDKQDSVTSGKWRRLTNIQSQDTLAAKALKTFRLKFDTAAVPELGPLQDIDWKLAMPHGDPTAEENRWVLEEEWTSLDVSQPKYGLGETVWEEEFEEGDNIHVELSTQSRVIITKNNEIKFRSHNGRLLKSITTDWNQRKRRSDSDSTSGMWPLPIQNLDYRFISVPFKNGKKIFDLDGNMKLDIIGDVQLEIFPGSTKVVFLIDDKQELYLGDLKNGKKIKLADDIEQFILTDKNYIITNQSNHDTKKRLMVYDLTGKLVNELIGEYWNISNRRVSWGTDFIHGKYILIQNEDFNLFLWDYLSKTVLKPPKEIGSLNWPYIVPNRPYIFFDYYDSSSITVWDYISNKITQLGYKLSYNTLLDESPGLIYSFNSEDSVFQVFDINKGKVTGSFKGYDYYPYTSWETTPPSKFVLQKTMLNNSKKDLLLQRQGPFQRLFASNCSVIKDFKAYDSTTLFSGFVNDSTIYTLSENGYYRTWDNKGRLSSEKILQGEYYFRTSEFEGYFRNIDKLLRSKKIYDIKGNLLVDNYNFSGFYDSGKVVFRSNASMGMATLFERPEAVYQLTLQKKEEKMTHHIWVYLKNGEINEIAQYQKARALKYETEISKIKKRERENINRAKAENRRAKNEQSLLRRFQIQQFGIYNYDILLNEDDRIQLAADFQFDVPLDKDNISVFLITRVNGPAVIQYYPGTWDTFSFDPDAPNMLLAVLPNDKTALFRREDFAALDVDKIAGEKKYTF